MFSEDGTLVRQLDGHEKGVISLSFAADGSLVSGSKDGTARVWSLGTPGGEARLEATLKGHENGVCVLGLPNGDIATGSTGQKVPAG